MPSSVDSEPIAARAALAIANGGGGQAAHDARPAST